MAAVQHPTRGVIVHEWIEPTGGSEKVVEAIALALPGTDIACAWDNAPGRFAGHRVMEGVLARSPLRGRKALCLPVLPFAWRRRVNPGYDWAVVSSHSFAHHVSFRGQRSDFQKFVYVHTPARYLWSPELDPRGQHPALRLAGPLLRSVDRRRAAEAASIAVNSRAVQDRVSAYWERPSVVIHPPVDVSRIQARRDWSAALGGDEAAALDRLPAEFLLGASRLISYKRLDAVIDLGSAARLPVVIAGDGPELPRLRARAASAGVPVRFLGRVSDPLLYALYQRAVAFVFPAIEDFGIMPVEAMAAGSPVVATSVGGTAETVLEGISGAVCDFRSMSDQLAALQRAVAVPADACRRHARGFDTEVFVRRFRGWVAPLRAVPDPAPQRAAEAAGRVGLAA